MVNWVFNFSESNEPVTGALPRGWDPDYNAGTTADIIVNAAGGADYTTIQDAVDNASANDVIAVRYGVYRELVDFTGAPSGITLKGYGTEKPLVTAQETLTGWTQCGTGDANRLGSTLGVSSSPIYKVNLNNSALASGAASSLNLYEGDTFIPIAQTKTGDLFFFNNALEYTTADSFTVNGSNQITQIQDSGILGTLTPAQVIGSDSNAFAYVWNNPNVIDAVNITAFDGVDTIDVDGLLLIQGQSDSGPADYKWNLANCLPLLTTGTYGYVDEGDGTTTIYVYPTNPSNISANMSYSSRDQIINFGTAEAITLEGLDIRGVSGTGSKTGNCIRKVSNSTKTSGHTIRHCRLGDIVHPNGNGYGAYMTYVDDTTIERCTIRNISGGFGTFFLGGTPGNNVYGNGNKFNQNDVTKCSQAALRVYENTNFQFTFTDISEVGIGAHGNVWNFYEQCDTILVYGVRSRNVGGYGTWQETSRIFIGFCDFQGMTNSERGSRTVVDQTNSTNQPTIPSLNYIWNCALHPAEVYSTAYSSLELGNWYNTTLTDTQPSNISYVVHNNIIFGGGVEEPYRTPNTNRDHWRNIPGYDDTHIERSREGNLYLAYQTNWQNSGAAIPWTLRASEDQQLTLSSVYTDYVNFDFTAPGGSKILTHPGVSLENTIAGPNASIISEAEDAFPEFDFNRDCDGITISDVTNVGVGPYQDDYNAQINWYTP